MTDIPGLTLVNVFVIAASFILMLLVNKETRSNSALLLVAMLIFHHLIAYLYAFHISLPENEADPATFLRQAEACIEFNSCGYLGIHLYVNYLAKMLEFGGSLYFVFLMNILYFVVSIYFFIGIAEILGLHGNRKAYLVLYSMWPSVIYFTTLHYREPFELYLLIAGVYFGLAGSKEDSFIKLLGSMVLLFIMGLFHIKGLLFLSPILFLIVSSYRMPLKHAAVAKRLSIVIVMYAGSYISYSIYSPDLKPENNAVQDTRVEQIDLNDGIKIEDENVALNPVESVGNAENSPKPEKIELDEANYIDKLINKIMDYRFALLEQREVRTAFISTLSDKNYIIFIISFSVVYLEYLFSPFFFQVSTFNEFIAYSESVLRLILFASSLVMLKRYSQPVVLFLVYLAITSMWAIGVVSFGASLRHHIQTNWILVLLGVPVISELVRNIITKKRRPGDKVSK